MASKKTKAPASDHADIKEHRRVAALSYVFILCLVPLLLKPHSKFAQFHAKQGLVLFVIDVLAGMIAWIPLFGQLLFFGAILLSVAAFVRALSGQSWEIPLIYDWSKKITVH